MLSMWSKTWRCDDLHIKIKGSLIFELQVDQFGNHHANFSDFPKSDEKISIWLVF